MRSEKKIYIDNIIMLHEKVIGGDNPRLEKALYKLTLSELDDLWDLFSLMDVPMEKVEYKPDCSCKAIPELDKYGIVACWKCKKPYKAILPRGSRPVTTS